MTLPPDGVPGKDGGADVPTATLVTPCPLAELSGPVLVWVHGYNDYFFHDHLRDPLASAGWTLCGLDLRRYGRNLGPNTAAAAVRQIADYGQELSAAVARLREHGAGPVVLAGHSTGGLAVTLALLRDTALSQQVDGVVLNAPFFAMPRLPGGRVVAAAVRTVARQVAKRSVLAGLQGRSLSAYGAAVSHPDQVPGAQGRWRFDPSWKRPKGMVLRGAWLLAIEAAQGEVRRTPKGLRPPCLVLHSATSRQVHRYTAASRKADTVLDVRAIGDIAEAVAADVQRVAVPGAMHDVFLSDPEPLAHAQHALLAWLAGLHPSDAVA